MVFVVIVDHGKASIAIAFVQADGRRVIGTYLKAQPGAIALQRAGLCAFQQALAQAMPAPRRAYRNRIQACQ
ncbi:hypothetical protein D3C77_733090 [compost metagenome]